MEEPKEVQETQDALPDIYRDDPEGLKEWPFDYGYARKMHDGKRIKRQFSFTEDNDKAFREFMEIYTGTEPARGKGIGSAILELFMTLGIAIISDFKLEEVGNNLRELTVNPTVRQRMSENLMRLAKLLE